MSLPPQPPDALERLVADLPRSLEPPRDLWASIEPRLAPRAASDRASAETRLQAQDQARAEHQSSPEPRSDRSLRRPLAWRLAAALAWMSLGALALLGVQAQLLDGSERTERAARAESADSPVVDPRPASDRGAPHGARSTAFVAAEMELLRAKDRLWLSVVDRRADLSPATFEVISRNLEIIDAAIEDLRTALAHDPANPRLEQALLDSHRRGLDLLRRAALEV